MKYINYTEINRYHKVGDKVWACAFEETRDTFGKNYFQEPIYGVLVSRQDKSKKEVNIEVPSSVEYFVPLKKNGVDLAWSKAVNTSSRKFADTKEECIEVFNDSVASYISYYKKKILELGKYIIQ